MNLLILITVLLSSELLISFSCENVEASKGTDTVHVEPYSLESITKFLNISEKIVGKITVTGGDNYILFKLYDPAGNPCLQGHILQSYEFSWGPVNFDGDYLFVFDNRYDLSSTNTVNFEYQILSTSDNSFLIIISVLTAVLAVTIISVAILLSRRGKKNRLFSSSELHKI